MPIERSVIEVLQDILRTVQEIIRAEVRLAKAEVADEASKAISSLAWIIVGAVGAVLSGSFALWAAVYALGQIWPMWAAALAVAVAMGLIGAILLTSGVRRLKNLRPTPERTVQTIKENVAWVRQSTK